MEEEYFLRYNHKAVIVSLVNGENIKGRLHTDIHNRFDVLLEIKENKKILIPKHGILIIEEQD